MVICYVYCINVKSVSNKWRSAVVVWQIDTARLNATVVFWKARLIHVVNYVCIFKQLQLKSKLHHTGTWSAAGCQPRCLCYRPQYSSAAAFSLRSHSREENSLHVKKKIFQLLYFLLFKICVLVNLLTLGIVCTPRSWTYEDSTIITVSLNTLKALKTSQYPKTILANLACV